MLMYTKLQPSLIDIDPDDAFSRIPYEKGSLLLRYLETLVTGGAGAMQAWLACYFKAFSGRSVTTREALDHFRAFFQGDAERLAGVEWDAWLSKPGLPPFDPRGVLDMSIADRARARAVAWADSSAACDGEDMSKVTARELMYSLDVIINGEEGVGAVLNVDRLNYLDKVHSLSSSRNVEVAFRFIMLLLRLRAPSGTAAAAQFLGSHGRGL